MAEPVDLRILQANERTLLAWIRTGLALMAFGFVIARLALWLRLETGPAAGSGSTIFGSLVIAAGMACHVFAAIRFVMIRKALVDGTAPQPGAMGPVIVALVVAGFGGALLVYLLVS